MVRVVPDLDFSWLELPTEFINNYDILHEAVMTWKRFPLNWEHTVTQMIELTEIWDAHVTSLQWTFCLRNISSSAPEGLSDRI